MKQDADGGPALKRVKTEPTVSSSNVGGEGVKKEMLTEDIKPTVAGSAVAAPPPAAPPVSTGTTDLQTVGRSL